jgi:prepilin signal peptidase PulO-like enzyme (type II secretory pathway)
MIDVIVYVCVFVAGALVGSFLNVVADRMESGKNPLFGRSICEMCKKPLLPKDLIPLVSYGWLRGRCRYCKETLSVFYPVSELLTGLMFVGVFYLSGARSMTGLSPIVGLIYMLIVAGVYIIIFLSDAKYKIIPNKVVLPAIIFVLSFIVFSSIFKLVRYYLELNEHPLGKYFVQAGFLHNHIVYSFRSLGAIVITAVAISAFFWFLILITKGRGMGWGDVKLGFLIGLVNGFPNGIVAIFLGFLLGAVYSVAMLVLRRKTMKDIIPFGPFLILGSVVAFVSGSSILTWYFGLL